MINMITLPYIPKTACWVHGRSEAQILLAMYVTEALSVPSSWHHFHRTDLKKARRQYAYTTEEAMANLIKCCQAYIARRCILWLLVNFQTDAWISKLIRPKYNPKYDTVVSADQSGMIEYWQPVSLFIQHSDFAQSPASASHSSRRRTNQVSGNSNRLPICMSSKRCALRL